MNFEMCGRTESEKTQKIVAPHGITTNQIEFSHGLGYEPTFQPAGVASASAWIRDAIAGLCELYHTPHPGGRCMLINKLPKGFAEITGAK